MSNAVEITDLVKNFGAHTVVNIKKLEIASGSTVGILGPNGAGKSTTINMMMGLLKPTSGTILYHGHGTFKKESLGLVPQDIALYPELNAIDNLRFFGSLYPSANNVKKRVHDMIKMIDLEGKAKSPVKKYSGGMKRRVNIGAALIHDPDIIFMDEPTVGIDPQSRNKIYEIINTLKEQHKTIVYTTHYMEEVERLCDYVFIIDYGNVIEQGTVKQLISKTKAGVLELCIEKADKNKVKNLIKKVTSAELFACDDQIYSVLLLENPQKIIGALMSLFEENGIQIANFTFHQPNLETLFLLLTGKALRE